MASCLAFGFGWLGSVVSQQLSLEQHVVEIEVFCSPFVEHASVYAGLKSSPFLQLSPGNLLPCFWRRNTARNLSAGNDSPSDDESADMSAVDQLLRVDWRWRWFSCSLSLLTLFPCCRGLAWPSSLEISKMSFLWDGTATGFPVPWALPQLLQLVWLGPLQLPSQLTRTSTNYLGRDNSTPAAVYPPQL